jgi:hypothetical protein
MIGAEELLKHLGKFGLRLLPVKEQDKAKNEEVAEVFGHHSPISRLLAEKFLHQAKEMGADGQPVEVLMLGDAAKDKLDSLKAAELTPKEVQGELNDLVASAQWQ